MTRPYANHASDAFNAWMEHHVLAVATEVQGLLRDRFVAIAITGSYACGEGGIQWVAGEERPTDAAEFLVVLDDARGAAAELARIAGRFRDHFAFAVRFHEPATPDSIRRWPAERRWFEALGTHRVLSGDAFAITENAPAALREPPPLIEASRSLLDGGASLLECRRIREGIERAPHADFVRSGVREAQLAIGDAFLAKHHSLTARLTGRDTALAEIAERDAVLRGLDALQQYRLALAWRLAPGPPEPEFATAESLRDALRQWCLAWLHIESVRVGVVFGSAEAYAAWPGHLEESPHSLRESAENLLRNVAHGRMSTACPREPLFRELPRLAVVASSPEWAQESADFLARLRAARG